MLAFQTQKPDQRNGHYFRFIVDGGPEFSPQFFDDGWLQASDVLSGHASGGRATAQFLNIENTSLVLRRFRRGGFARRLSTSDYIWTGLEQTRAFAEFNCLVALDAQRLPAPKPYACEVVRSGITYQASLITHRIAGQTLAKMQQGVDGLKESVMHQVGRCIARFHSAGVCHADLNAHNILVELAPEPKVSLIDFDKALLQQHAQLEWRQKNLDRLHRSLRKEQNKRDVDQPIAHWQSLLAGYRAELSGNK
ncbi:MAG: 3-deoxy-D-manno-octulosonic acid kinase [Gammaproteobacteria bacterium]|nr:3-deoxy-D-manno-octulosonic acid kinase [Gammaproteobacteria bacterium]